VANIKLRRYEDEKLGLPNLSMRCGAPATIDRARSFSWYPPWILITILAGILICAILALILTKRMRVTVPLCHEHRNHWKARALFNLFCFLALIALVIGAGVLSAYVNNDTAITLAWLTVGLAFFAWLVGAAIAQATAIRPTEITDRSITLNGVAKEFADAVLDGRDQRAEEEEEYYDRRRPQRRRLESDAYYDPEERRRPRRRSRDEEH
jgi:hypothetical protein